ncbi:hypothetical protein MMC28_010927 [Mycoblastus sanguinarius]|nr:hypothetical protein [Mycoblastus sanguinarius]
MKYLQNVIREAMRLYHPAYSIISLHRRSDLLGPTADTFNPHRWDEWKPPLWEFIPFNHGPRICLGRNFGQFQLGYTLVRIFQEFEGIELVGLGKEGWTGEGKDGEQRIKIEMNTKMSEDIWVTLVKGGK